MFPPRQLDRIDRRLAEGRPGSLGRCAMLAHRPEARGPPEGTAHDDARAVHRWRGEPQGSLGGAPFLESAATFFFDFPPPFGRHRSSRPVLGGQEFAGGEDLGYFAPRAGFRSRPVPEACRGADPARIGRTRVRPFRGNTKGHASSGLRPMSTVPQRSFLPVVKSAVTSPTLRPEVRSLRASKDA